MFEYLINQDADKNSAHKYKIGPGDLTRVLNFLGRKSLKSEVNLIIWEVDDDLDGYVSKDEYCKMYKRCISDETGLEPRKLFNLV